jgi:riboflavin synthase
LLTPEGSISVFSGIVEDLGEIKDTRRSAQGAVLTIRTAMALAKIKIGDSICTSGVCLTVTAKGRGAISMDVSAETLRRSTLGMLQVGAKVNLERSLTLGSLIGGHLVAGHVDGRGKLVSIGPEGDSKVYTFEAPVAESRYLVEKGSVTLDGVSLTVFNLDRNRFSVALIAHTLAVTTLGLKSVGDPINYESDLLGKYIEKFVAARFEIGRSISARGQTA